MNRPAEEFGFTSEEAFREYQFKLMDEWWERRELKDAWETEQARIEAMWPAGAQKTIGKTEFTELVGGGYDRNAVDDETNTRTYKWVASVAGPGMWREMQPTKEE